MNNEITDIEYGTVKQRYYGNYCNMCRELNIAIIPYFFFKLKDYKRVKQLFKQSKKMLTLKTKDYIPEGYEIDKDKSSFEEIVFKKIEKKLITSWEELEFVEGRYINNDRVYFVDKVPAKLGVKGIYPTKEQAEAGLLLPQLLQVRDYLRAGWTPSKDKECYCVVPDGEQLIPYRLTKDNFNIMYGWLTFPTKELCEHFIQYFGDQVIDLTTKLA